MHHRYLCGLILALLSVYACSQQTAQHDSKAGANCQTSAYFSRRGGDADPLITALNQAQKSMRVAIYGLTHPGIVDALTNARSRGVDVALKTDKIQSAGRSQGAAIAKLEAAGIPVEVCQQTRLLHHKFAVLDGRRVVTGSFNWTVAAENQNRENFVLLDCPQIAQTYSEEWESIRRDAP